MCSVTCCKNAVNWLVGQGVNVIAFDGLTYEQSWFDDGAAAAAAETAAESGVVFVSAAGDADGEIHYQGVYNDSDADDHHNFGSSENFLVFNCSAAGNVTVDLQWSDPWNAPA